MHRILTILFTLSYLSNLNVAFAQEYTKYVSRNDPKAKGINFGIKYPADWIVLDADRPNVVAKLFAKGNLSGVTITIKKMGKDLDVRKFNAKEIDEVKDELISPTSLKSYLGENTYIKGDKKIQLDNITGSKVEFINKTKLIDDITFSYVTIYNLWYEDYMISIVFGTKATTDGTMRAKYSEMKSVFDKMMLSFTVYNQYQK